MWVDRNGREEPLDAPTNRYHFAQVSPDGTKVALAIFGDNVDIWIWDLVYKNLTRLTFDDGNDLCPLWTHDGKRIVFRSARDEGGTL